MRQPLLQHAVVVRPILQGWRGVAPAKLQPCLRGQQQVVNFIPSSLILERQYLRSLRQVNLTRRRSSKSTLQAPPGTQAAHRHRYA